MNPTRTEAIKKVLLNSTWADLANLYNHDMEVQVNVAQDGGERHIGEYMGRQWLAWTDGFTIWKSFRIPYNANTTPEYEDKTMSFDLGLHAEGIGMTGWDWKNQVSRWFAYDFDALVGHSDRHNKKLSDIELNELRNVVSSIPWVTLRTSTSGKGLHLYVRLTKPEPTKNHHEHAALARAILSYLTAVTTYDFVNKVDICGGNMWVFHRKMIQNGERVGLKLIKEGVTLDHIPVNWHEHVEVVSGRRAKIKPSFIPDEPEAQDLFEELTGQRTKVPLDAQHKALLDYLANNNCAWSFQQDHWMLITHTIHLKEAHTALHMKGEFNTLATGTERGHDHNCYAYPLPHGAWSVRRYSQGVKEADSWEQDGKSWTKCYLNRELELDAACKVSNGNEHPKGGYHFNNVVDLAAAVKRLGGEIVYNDLLAARPGFIKPHREETKITVQIACDKHDTSMPGWIKEGNKFWTRVVQINIPSKLEAESKGNFDDVVRHIVTLKSEDCGWMLRAEGYWNDEPFAHIKAALDSMGHTADEKKTIIGENLFKPWRIVNLPFEPEYPGDRTWNRNAAQLKYAPSPEIGTALHWDMILNHCGSNLDEACLENAWCKANGIVKGAEYLKCWIASMIQQPKQPLPYLFFYSSEQDNGKSIFHEALELLLLRGCMRADAALTSTGGFNGELEAAVLCVVEEIDLNSSKQAANRIKDWVTSRNILIHRKSVTPYLAPNTTHWIQCSNYVRACPIFPGDTRITMIHVPVLPAEKKIPKRDLVRALEKEAPDFLASLLKLELPYCSERLNIPVLTTSEKMEVEATNENYIEQFIRSQCYQVDGCVIRFSEFRQAFLLWLNDINPDKKAEYNQSRVSIEIPRKIPKGRLTNDPNIHLGNLTFDKSAVPSTPYVTEHLYIRRASANISIGASTTNGEGRVS